jgi:hypothetical protein
LAKIAENCDHNIDPWSPCLQPSLFLDGHPEKHFYWHLKWGWALEKMSIEQKITEFV